MELTYEKNGDYLIPNLVADSGPEEPLTKYGLMHKDYLEKNHRGIFSGMLLEGTLWSHCLEVQRQAEQRMDCMTARMAKAEGVDEKLKASNQMAWVRKMNTIRHSAEESVLAELVYSL